MLEMSFHLKIVLQTCVCSRHSCQTCSVAAAAAAVWLNLNARVCPRPAVLLLLSSLLSCPNVAGVCPRTVPPGTVQSVQCTTLRRAGTISVGGTICRCRVYNTPSRYRAQPARHRDVSPPTTPLLVLATSCATPLYVAHG